MRVKDTIISLMMLLAATAVQAQISIGGNVYGGGNAGDTGGSTSVTVRSGDINAVYGGARMANVKGGSTVNLDGENASTDILIADVFGGNDISGTIGQETVVRTSPCKTKRTVTIEGVGEVSADEIMLVVGSLFGGGNGDYTYKDANGEDLKDADGNYIVRDGNGNTVVTSKSALGKPELTHTTLDLKGGCIAHVYGGGNNATVTESTTINIDNSSDDLEKAVMVWAAANKQPIAEVFAYLQTKVKLSTFQSNLSSYAFNFARIFGGNNKAEMAIRPTWNLQKGIIRDLYSGGNQGAMTNKEGLLLEIDPTPDAEGKTDGLVIENVYGGCRMADVRPLVSGTLESGVYEETKSTDIQLSEVDASGAQKYKFPAGLSARVLVRGGDINNVYGGNDITGKVYGGNAVGVYTTIRGDVYGGGNGSYAYTDNADLGKLDIFKDFYYNPGGNSMAALNAFRPNAEQVSIRLSGKVDKPTIIHGSVYLGGNSATIMTDKTNPMVELKIGSYVIADNVFLGNNGANMIDDNILQHYAGSVDASGDVVSAGTDYSSLDLTVPATFSSYMDGAAMSLMPSIVFDKAPKDPATYIPYTSTFGSLFCGGNVGSMTKPGKTSIDFQDEIIIYEKVVGGCNNANIAAREGLNAAYEGGILGNPDNSGNKLELTFAGLKLQPKRWNADQTALVWNTVNSSGEEVNPVGLATGMTNDDDLDRRLSGGNIYGGCYNSGHVNGNVILNINQTLVDRKGEFSVFDETEEEGDEAVRYGENYNITQRHSGVILDPQGDDVLGKALNVFGGGFGPESEIWGSTTVNVNAGYAFQVFGGGEQGPVGKADPNGTYTYHYKIGDEARSKKYSYNPAYSCYVNLRGDYEGVYRGHADDRTDMAETEYLYGGAFEAPIAGNTYVSLGNGRTYQSFGGSCNADILGHTETYVGRQANNDGTFTDGAGFPWIRDNIFGGNDLGGRVMNAADFMDRVTAELQDKVYNPTNGKDAQGKPQPVVTNASAYVEYQQGRVSDVFGGCYGDYDYTDEHYKDYTNADGSDKDGFTKPRMDNAFVNFKPTMNTRNLVEKIYGAGQGHEKGMGVDSMQNRSYVLVEIPQTITTFQNVPIFGAGANCGLGIGVDPKSVEANPYIASTVIDLVSGKVKNAYGGSFAEGITRRTVVNVPRGATIQLDSIFGGAYGKDPLYPCDVYEAQVNYHSEDATVNTIFGGNNSADRTLYGQINIDVPVWQDKKTGYLATVFGAGFGKDTWSQYTEVNLLNGAKVYEVYGGGKNGKVFNTETLCQWRLDEGEALDLTLPGYEDTSVTYKDNDNKEFYLDAGLRSPLAHAVRMDGKSKFNTNVHIYKGATVEGYAYGGGLGADAVVSGTTYIDLLGGTVIKDLYAAGTSGAVLDERKAQTFTASATAYIEGGTVRNVYGGGWEGHVGYSKMETDASGKTVITENIPGETNVVIGIRKDRTAALPTDYGFYDGVPAIQRNAYAGGEGGAVYGKAHLTMNNGYIGYTYHPDTGEYEEKLHDETWSDHVGKDRLSDCGNLFGGGYDDNSSVDESYVTMWGGIVRNSIFGGGEIATIGRGATKESGVDNKDRELKAIYKAGGTHIKMYNGHVKRNIFGGGKGYNILGYGGIHGFYTDGYVFGKTEVYIHGGEIGTAEGLASGYGNVFGGGDVGYVYSKGYFNSASGKTSTGSPNHYYYYDDDGSLTEDCKVIVAPMLQVKPGKSVTYEGVTYGPYDYVPTDYLNTLPSDKTLSVWTDLFTGDKLPNGEVNPEDPEERGIHIRNAVFAGGNVSSNSESYNNATTVFGNTTATLYDVYHHDFITVGTEHTGGLYGGGNLSVVGGYRELNITNYGTDYYGLDQQITLEEYQTLTNRERAYFKLEYLCQKDVIINGKEYKQNDRIGEDEYNAMPDGYKNETYWVQYGFCSIYAGRLLNTIQRADFCGVYGSRLVLQGAKDRVADVGDATEYTINRVGEVSLNLMRFKPGDDSDLHGNYFGIYSVVNYMGNLTSDVHFTDNRRYVDKGQVYESEGESYYDWKTSRLSKRDRNNGTAFNQVALASGVFLELTSENSTTTNKIYGDITGVIELDLINVKKDIEGGGYVYARNEHRIPKYFPNKKNVLLSEYNQPKIVDGAEWRDEACTHKRYVYCAEDEQPGDGEPQLLGKNEPYTLKPYQTTGNFIHKSKRIIDDCYPNNGVYDDGYVKSPAHYWFIKGEVYIYDQVVSAYAGSASAYSKEVKIPLTITAGSNGRLKLLNVQPNLYAYYADETRSESNKVAEDGVKVDNESVTYHLNDVISWWDWHQLSNNEQKYFVKETYVNVDTCYADGVMYPSGTYVLENDASLHGGDASQTAYQKFLKIHPTFYDSSNNEVTDLTKLFHSSNNIGHETGYVLTLDMNSPKDWDDWYSPVYTVDGDKIPKETYLTTADQSKYREGPTYTLTGASGLYGQREYGVGEIITKEVYDDYTTTVGKMHQQPSGQASAEPAYVAMADFGNTQAGNAISETEYNALSDKSNFRPAMVCINTIQTGDEEYVLLGELVSGTDADLEALAQKYKAYNNSKVNADQIDDAGALEYVKSHLSDAYYIKTGGLYGGQYFEAGENYGAIKTWCSLTDARDKFDFNYDAFDVLVDPQFHGEGYTETYYHSPYSDEKAVEYEASYAGTGTYTYYDNKGQKHTIDSGQSISREEFENVRNEQLHYTRIQVEKGSDLQTVYVVTENIVNSGTPYAKGQDITEKDYKSLTHENQEKVNVVTFQKGNETAVKYYCFEAYSSSVDLHTESGSAGAEGSVVSADVFNNDVPNYQKAFSIQGTEPTETTTLYVSRESNAKDVTSEKVISVIYQYTYYEADDEGEGVSMVNELHVLNIHLQLESGAPEIGQLNPPSAVLPGNTLGLKAPTVNPGLYEVLTSGWEMFNSEEDAMLHRNGIPFTNNGTPLYWYQNQKVWLAFYSKTYLGKTYSNYVPLTVANYHDIDAVMKDKEHHLYVDHPQVMRNSKIYINGGDCESDPDKSKLDLLKDFFDLSVSGLDGHSSLDPHVRGGADLEFILSGDVGPKKYTDWTPVGNDTQCFEGNLHGDGYTISGLNNSLFGNLCGSVYNLGVTGSFTSAGVVDKGVGYVENCWISTTGKPDGSVKAVFGNPTAGSSVTQVVNSYYPNSKNYKSGAARAMSETDFYNGTVAYNLNGFYLNKRYYDKKQTSGTAYQYLKDVDGTLSENMITGYYPEKPDAAYGDVGYVESRYEDGDFIYADGKIPDAYDDRMRVTHDGTSTIINYAPIWPDDYLYFGQMLTYDYNLSRPHNAQPAHIVKSSGRLPVNDTSNRVYRAPAYYRSKAQDVAHFNLWAYLAAYSKAKSVTDTDMKAAYPNMTAIDFAGLNDNAYTQGYSGKLFYQPLLDNDDGLLNITNEGETSNLLVYAPSAEANEKTYDVLATYFVDPDYATYYVDDDTRTVKAAPTSSIHGHLVQSDLTATSDHLLVDKQDFNAPIAYTFDETHRMWHQRTPDRYVDTSKGWESVSLPFTAELVSTHQKGEITHFYSGSKSIDSDTETKIGHEYWLREMKGLTTSGDVATAYFNYPDDTGKETKTATNTFLWDYYYQDASDNARKDANGDTYQQFYSTARAYPAYPYVQKGTPYIVGFPGTTYYEFDLSGNFTAKSTASPAPNRLDRQVITFASKPGETVDVSDSELEEGAVGPYSNYYFKPNYLNIDVPTNGYLMAEDGGSYVKVDDETIDTKLYAFRSYFDSKKPVTRSIKFSSIGSQMGGNDDDQGNVVQSMDFYAKKHAIVVTSHMLDVADVGIFTVSGLCLGSFNIQPNETIETPVNTSGVYIVRAARGHYVKKVTIK